MPTKPTKTGRRSRRHASTSAPYLWATITITPKNASKPQRSARGVYVTRGRLATEAIERVVQALWQTQQQCNPAPNSDHIPIFGTLHLVYAMGGGIEPDGTLMRACVLKGPDEKAATFRGRLGFLAERIASALVDADVILSFEHPTDDD